jgi:hypothetical protein
MARQGALRREVPAEPGQRRTQRRRQALRRAIRGLVIRAERALGARDVIPAVPVGDCNHAQSVARRAIAGKLQDADAAPGPGS